MILLYTVLLTVLGVAHWVCQRRAGALGKAYAARAATVLKMLQTAPKPGNSGKHDPCATAKQQFELGRVVTQRDRCETKWYAAQQRAERLSRFLVALRDWKGRKLPYSLGVLDVWLVLSLIDRLGVGEVIGPSQVIVAVREWLEW